MPEPIAPGPVDATTDKNVSVNVEHGYDPNKPISATNVKPVEPAKPADSVDLKAWAKTSSENRALKTQVADLTSKLDAASKLGTPEAINAAVMEQLKKPETLKLLKKSGIEFQKIADEFLVDDEPENPEIKAQRERIEKLEKEANDKKSKEEQDRENSLKAADEAKTQENRKIIAGYVGENADKLVEDAKDSRFGTPRWVLINGDEDAYAAAHQAFIDYVVEKKIPDDKIAEWTKENAPKLIEQALDKIEIQLRASVMPKLDKLRPNRTNNEGTGSKESRTTDKDWRPKTSIPTLAIDRAATSSAPPAATVSKKFSSGPVQIKYTS